jgi:ATP-dependent exoDNAse (exonuclease V) beta subunit
VCRRSGAELLRISRAVAEGLPGPWEHRRLAAAEGTTSGEAAVHVFGSAAVEAAYLADVLRRAHLLDGLAWSEMAVVVRSATALGPLRRALAQAGVPVAVSADDLPLAAQPAVAPFLQALEALLPSAGPDGAPTGLDEPAAEALLASPLGGATVLDLRRLRRAVRLALAGRGIDAAERGAPLATLLEDDTLLGALPEHVARTAARVSAVLSAGRVALAAGGTAEDVLWAMWQRSGLAGRWARASAAGGPAGAVADRDLDAVVALFDAAAGFVDRLPSADVRAFLAHLSAQELPAGTGAAGPGAAAETVRLLTAHASKGLEWDLVCIAGVQEGVWPDVRERVSLLGTEELMERAADLDAAVLDRRTQALAEEKRLFYVACTRARRRLVVTAVQGGLDGADAGATASRFLDLVAPPPPEGRALTELPRSLTLPALVAELRRAVTDPHTPADRRAAAASVLRRLGEEHVPGAAPAGWWGLAALSDDAPLVDPEDAVRVRPSHIENYRRCPLRWVLGTVGAESPPDLPVSVGSAVHQVAQQVAEGLPPEEAPAALETQLDGLLGSGWFDRRQREDARKKLDRFLQWHAADARALLGAEVEFDVVVGRAHLRGSVDRLERDGEGRLVVVDLKTGSRDADAVEEHGQLAAYQLAVASGAFPEHGTEPGGAALVQIGGSRAKAKEQRQEPLPTDVPPEETPAGRLLAEVADGMGAATFEVRTGTHCQRCPSRRSCPLHEHGGQVTR